MKHALYVFRSVVLSVCVVAAALLPAQVEAMPSYDWVDVELVSGAGTVLGTQRMNYLSSLAGDSSHTYDASNPAGGIYGQSHTATDLVASENGVEFQYVGSFTQASGTQKVSAPELSQSTTPTDLPLDLGGTSTFMRITGWGPVRNGTTQNDDGLHEPREWIEIRLVWDGGTVALPGSWQGQLQNIGAGNYTTNVVEIVHTLTESFGIQPELIITDNQIDGNPGMYEGPGESSGGWEKIGIGVGDYVGPLDANFNSVDNFGVTSFIIIAMGPTIGGGGGDEIGDPGGGPPAGPGGDPGGGIGAPPGDDDGDGEIDPNDFTATGIDCIDNFLFAFREIEAVNAFYDLTVNIGEADASIDLPLQIPGQGTSNYSITSKPDTSTTFGAALDGVRQAVRVVFTVWFGWMGLNAIFGVLVRW